MFEIIKRWRVVSSVVQENLSGMNRLGQRIKNRRKFRLDRLDARVALTQARKWMWIALMVAAAVVGIIALKMML